MHCLRQRTLRQQALLSTFTVCPFEVLVRRNLSYALAGLCLLTSSILVGPFAHAQAALTRNELLARMDTDMRDVILLYDAIKGTHLEQLTPQDARQQFSAQDAAKIIARGAAGDASATPVGKVIDGLAVPGQGTTQIPIRIYEPAGAGPFPVIVYYHGGGFVVATIDTYDESARALCNGVNAIVVSVEYRKAPEAPFPAARVDAIDAYRWVTNNIATYNGLPRQVAVAGESAGGNLATEVAIAARNSGFQLPVHQLLIYPETTSDLSQTSDKLFTNSTLPLYTAELPYFDGQYVQNPSDKNSPQVAPINANLKGLPPTTIIAAELDPLVSDGQDYFLALKAAGNKVNYRLFSGTTHEFFGMGAVVAKAKVAEDFGAKQISTSFGN